MFETSNNQPPIWTDGLFQPSIYIYAKIGVGGSVDIALPTLSITEISIGI
jgi:hypothetical protein